jgi:hypothetical protein
LQEDASERPAATFVPSREASPRIAGAVSFILTQEHRTSRGEGESGFCPCMTLPADTVDFAENAQR